MISANEPEVAATGRYSVTETCAQLGICKNTLRRYTELGLIRCGFRRGSGRKFYTGSEIIRFWRAQM